MLTTTGFAVMLSTVSCQSERSRLQSIRRSSRTLTWSSPAYVLLARWHNFHLRRCPRRASPILPERPDRPRMPVPYNSRYTLVEGGPRSIGTGCRPVALSTAVVFRHELGRRANRQRTARWPPVRLFRWNRLKKERGETAAMVVANEAFTPAGFVTVMVALPPARPSGTRKLICVGET